MEGPGGRGGRMLHGLIVGISVWEIYDLLCLS